MQINKATEAKTEIRHEPQMDESGDDDEDVDDMLYTEEQDESELSSEDDE